MQSRRFIQCDVFSPIPTQGNALAVVVDGHGLSEDQMRRFAAWTNLAETTGTAIGRHGRVSIRPSSDDSEIRIGGRTHLLIDGTVNL